MTSPSLPSLPPIQGDYNIMLDIYTDESARNPDDDISPEYGHPSRLKFFGEKAAEAAAFYHFFTLGTSSHPSEDGQLLRDQIDARVRQALDSTSIVMWMEAYGLKGKIRCFPHTLRSNPDVVVGVFWTYVGALYLRSGPKVVQDWISGLINPGHPPPHMVVGGGIQDVPMHPPMPPLQATGMPTYPPQPAGHPPPPPPAGPPPTAPLTGTDTLITLQVVNQTAQQKGYLVTYNAASDGPPHNPTWTVKCLLNGQEMGEGRARGQKAAKEEAARMAYKAMGW